MNDLDNHILKIINEELSKKDSAFNIRKNGQSVEHKSTDNIKIESKKDKDGIDVKIESNTKYGYVHIPVILTESGINEKVYNDFYIGDNCSITINAGCGIHNDMHKDSEHDGIHRFFVGKDSYVKYIEKHYGEGNGTGKKILNPETEIYLGESSTLEMDTAQIKGVSSTIRSTKAILEDNATLVINEKIMTHDNQYAKTNFYVELNGKNSSVKVTSRSVATNDSKQDFVSNLVGNNECFGHVECDAIIKDNGKVTSDPKIIANNIDAKLIHEASIGKIAGDQLIKLMSLGLTKEECEETIINGFLK